MKGANSQIPIGGMPVVVSEMVPLTKRKACDCAGWIATAPWVDGHRRACKSNESEPAGGVIVDGVMYVNAARFAELERLATPAGD